MTMIETRVRRMARQTRLTRPTLRRCARLVSPLSRLRLRTEERLSQCGKLRQGRGGGGGGGGGGGYNCRSSSMQRGVRDWTVGCSALAAGLACALSCDFRGSRDRLGGRVVRQHPACPPAILSARSMNLMRIIILGSMCEAELWRV